MKLVDVEEGGELAVLQQMRYYVTTFWSKRFATSPVTELSLTSWLRRQQTALSVPKLTQCCIPKLTRRAELLLEERLDLRVKPTQNLRQG